MRRKNIKIRQFPLMGARINSTYIGRQCKKIFVTGDSLNNIHLYAFDSDQQITCFSSSTSANNVQNQTSAVAINSAQDQVYSGSNRGIINIWDIKTGKSNILLKGHSTSVNCFGVFPSEYNRVASGSYDTNIKLWDIRQKNNNATLKGHSKQVNAIQISPDGRILFSGSQDNTIKLWDLRYPQKILVTFTQHTGPITKVICHPEQMMFASCSMDKTAKSFYCQPPNKLSFISSTQMVSTPITAITFDEQGEYLFTAANDVLKCWSMTNKGALMESIQSPWKGVLDLCWKQNGVLGIAANNQYLSIWAFDTKQKNTRRLQKSQYMQPLILPNIHRKNDIQKDLFEALQNVQKANEIMANCQINAIKKKQYFQKPSQKSFQKPSQDFSKKAKIEQPKFHQNQPYQNIQEQININADQQVTQRIIPKNNMKISPARNSKQINIHSNNQNYSYGNNCEEHPFKPQNYDLQKPEYKNQDFNQKLSQNIRAENMPSNLLYQNLQKRLSEDEHQFQMTMENDVLENSSIMNISTFVGNSQQKEKLKQIQLIGQICKDVGKFQNVMSQRLKIIKSFLHLWKIGRAPKSFQILKQVDQGIIYDCLFAVIRNNSLRNGISPQNAVKMLQLLTLVMKNKHSTYVKGAMQLINQIVNMFKDQIIKVKTFNSMSKVDPSRQQRVAKIDRLIQQLLNVFKQERLKKYSSSKLQTQNQDLVVIAKQLYKNLQQVLRALMPKKQPQAA